VKLKNRLARVSVCRVYARETTVLPSDMQINVPIRMPIANWHVPWCDWVTEPREIRPGVYAASTMLPGVDTFAAIRFINLSGQDQIVHRGTFLGKAVPGQVMGESSEQNSV